MTGVPRKPTEGDPCNGCGVCCVAIPCPTARDMGVATFYGPCPALEWENGRSWCGLVRHPSRYIVEAMDLGPKAPFFDAIMGPMFAEALGGTGGGCDSTGRDGFSAADQANFDALQLDPWIEIVPGDT